MKSEFSKQVCHNYAFTWFLNCTITISGQEKRMNQSNRCIANKKKIWETLISIYRILVET